jgi:hypothetical protein
VIRGNNAEAKEHAAAAVFVAYSHVDKRLKEQLVKHLCVLEREGLVRVWHDGCVVPGRDWNEEIRLNLNRAEVILLLISADFVASEYCYAVEMKTALNRHQKGDAAVVPIILRDSDWSRLPIAELQALPDGAKPVTKWSDRDAAYKNVTQGVRRAIAAITGGHRAGFASQLQRIDLLAHRPSIKRKTE